MTNEIIRMLDLGKNEVKHSVICAFSGTGTKFWIFK